MHNTVVDRASGEVISSGEFGSKALKALYATAWGRIMLKAVFIRPWFSALVSVYYSSRFSSRKIAKFIELHGIDMSLYREEDYRSFNDFFIRKFKPGVRTFDTRLNLLCSPADASLLHTKIDSQSRLTIKSSPYTVEELLGDWQAADGFSDGDAFVLRLTMADCHRYQHIDDGRLISQKSIPGVLHSVRGIATNSASVYHTNSRVVSLIETRHYGRIAMVEVGALLVGKIRNNELAVRRGQEKGYFEFGGSTIVILFEKDKVTVDADLLTNSSQGRETVVKMGEPVGSAA